VTYYLSCDRHIPFHAEGHCEPCPKLKLNAIMGTVLRTTTSFRFDVLVATSADVTCYFFSVRRLIKQNASMRVRNFRDRQRIVKFEKEIKLKSNRNMVRCFSNRTVSQFQSLTIASCHITHHTASQSQGLINTHMRKSQ